MKYLKPFKIFESNKPLDFDTVEDIFQEYVDDRKCQLKRGEHFIIVGVVDGETANQVKETLDSWGFKYSLRIPTKESESKFWTFCFWDDTLKSEFIYWLDKAKIKKETKDGMHVLWCENKNKKSWLFQQDSKNKQFGINYNKIWSIFKLKYRMEYEEIKKFTEDTLYEHLKLGGYTTQFFSIVYKSYPV